MIFILDAILDFSKEVNPGFGVKMGKFFFINFCQNRIKKDV